MTLSREQSQRTTLLGLLGQRLGGEHIITTALLLQAIGDRLGLNTTDLTCLYYLNDAETLTAGQLAEISGLTTGSVTIVIDRLEKAGYVQREKDPADRRKVVVRPNSARMERDLAPLYAAVGDAWVQTLEQYSTEELGTILDMLTRSAVVVREQIAELRRAEPATSGAADALKPAAERVAAQARLTFTSGVWKTLVVGAPLSTLYQGALDTPEPRTTTTNGITHLTIRSGVRRDPPSERDAPPARFPALPFFRQPRRMGMLTLNATTTWQIEIRGGASASKIDLSALSVTSLGIADGMYKVELLLGQPHGTVPISILGGAADVVITRPQGFAIKLRVDLGATNVRLDNRFESVVYNDDWHTPDYATATDRYEITVAGGASHLSIVSETAQP